MQKKLSIITICYNEPDLEKTCESIVNQTWQDFEWIVIDGGSNQETLDIFEKYKYRIDTFISEPDNGIYNAMNKGIKLAEGEYLNFINAGDGYYDKNVLQDVINSKLDKDIVFGEMNGIYENGERIVYMPDKIYARYLYYATVLHPSSFIKKKLFDKYGMYNESLRIISDWEKWIEFFVVHKCSYKHIHIVCSFFNLNGISSTNLELLQKEREIVLNKYFTPKELENFRKEKYNLTLLEQIFSVKNSPDKKHKIITIFGVKLKIRKHN